MATSVAELRPVEPSVWRAAAGTSVTIPAVSSRVYYFPQGHSEQSSCSLSLSPLSPISPMVPCRVTALLFLANPDTDEVFARIRLFPYPRADVAPSPHDVAPAEQMLSYAKVLTPSDANNGGGFSVPRFCADSIFPPLDFSADPPVQNIMVRDVHGAAWEFRHIYRGTPRRHLLTTGWGRFVNNKKLISGDSVVFMRNVHSGELSVGIRRAVRCDPDCSNLLQGSWGNGKGRVMPESVAKAAELAARGLEFEVLYYPRVGWSDFVVGADVVEESLNTFWSVGMKVKMAKETDDSSRMTWHQGTVLAAMVPDAGPWKGSPWKMLQVVWDEPEYLQHLKRVSPWQVEHVMPPSPPHSALRPTKKSRITQNPALQTDVVQDLSFPISGLSNSLMGNFNPSMLSHYSLPAGMQGARQSQFFVSGLSSLICGNTNQICGLNTFGNDMSPKLKAVSTELNVHSSQSEILSSDSQSSVYLFGTEIVGKQGYVSSTKAGLNSFQLFGKTIHVKDPVESNSDDAVSAEGNGITLLEEAESAKISLALSLTVPCKDLLAGVDTQGQSAPAVEAFPL